MSGSPRFVVVGHPNKGKSSIVATLAQDASVRIADESGTTRVSRAFPMQVDGREVYRLVDTPGFQRARKALAWLEAQGVGAEGRAEAVRAFVREFATQGEAGGFRDECELLGPIVAEEGASGGAGILYVVDGSVPYGPEYEAEMQVLRWTGVPRMALINLIGEADHVEAWRSALGQYFSVVRVFDAVKAEFDKQVDLLRAFGQLHEPWREAMDEAAGLLERRRTGQREASARAIAEMLAEALTHTEQGQVGFDADTGPTQGKLQEKYRQALRRIERRGREAVEQAYGHPSVGREETELDVLNSDLFSEASQRVFGLTRTQAAQLGLVSGAGLGVMVDVALHGLTFGVFTAAGSLAGGAAAWLGFDKVARTKVMKLRSLGVQRVTVGPLVNVNLRHTLLARAVVHHRVVAARTHAQRGGLVVDDTQTGALNPLSPSDSKKFNEPFKRLLKAGDDEVAVAEAVDTIAGLVQALLSD